VAYSDFDFEAFFPDPKSRIQKLFDHGRNGRHAISVETLVPVDNKALLHRFEQARRANPNLKVEFGFHGTAAANHGSIKNSGLMIPKTSLQVVNGSAFGHGIYISRCPMYSTGYVRGKAKMFVVAVLTGDTRVFQNGNIMVAKDESLVVPYYVMHYSGVAVSNGGVTFVHNPVFQYLSWYIIAALVFLGVNLASYLLTGTFMTLTWFIGWGRLPDMRFFEFVFSGGTSSVLFYVSWIHGFSYVVLRLVVYCMAWKAVKFIFWYIVLPPFTGLWALLNNLPVISTLLSLVMFCFKVVGLFVFATFTSFKFYVVLATILIPILCYLLLNHFSKSSLPVMKRSCKVFPNNRSAKKY
jgi:hypothetical protein